MREPTVADVMTRKVVAVRPDAGIKEVVAALVSNRISALPVIDAEQRPVGVVSEADLLPKTEFRGGVDRPRAISLRARSAWQKSTALLAGDVMTRSVLTVEPTEPVFAAARRLAEIGVRRLLVVDDGGRLIGILSRRDLLRAFLRTDEELRSAILRMFREVLWVDPDTVDVNVTDGFVSMFGVLERASEVSMSDRFVRAMPGVVGLDNGLRFQFDDSGVTAPR